MGRSKIINLLKLIMDLGAGQPTFEHLSVCENFNSNFGMFRILTAQCVPVFGPNVTS